VPREKQTEDRSNSFVLKSEQNSLSSPKGELIYCPAFAYGLPSGNHYAPKKPKSSATPGKGGPYGKRSKKRVVPMSRRIQALLEPYFALNEKWFIGKRQAQKIVKRVASAHEFLKK
jgi:hypothetical protein